MSQRLFLSGIGRSGTTALRRSLGLHPQIYYNGKENNVVQDVVEVAHKNLTTQSRRNSLVVSEESYLNSFRKLVEEIVWPPKQDQSSRLTWMAATNLDRRHMPTMCRMFPAAKFICLVRNGLSVVASRMRYKSFHDVAFEDHCGVWLRSAKMAAWASENNSLAKTLRQEDFLEVTSMDARLGELFDWLGLARSDEVAKNFVSMRYHATDENASFEIKAADYERFDDVQRREFESRRQARWRDWTEDQREIFAQICSSAMHKLGYEMPWLIAD